MSIEQYSVTAVIPVQGPGEGLAENLPSVLAGDYNGVMVATGATGKDREQLQAELGDHAGDVTVLTGAERANDSELRNLALRTVLEQGSGRAVLHYMSADSRLTGGDPRAVARRLVEKGGTGMIGGLIVGEVGLPDPFTHGPAFSPMAYAGGAAQELVHSQVRAGRMGVARAIRHALAPVLRGYLDTTKPKEDLTRAETFWVQEPNTMVQANVLDGIGGYPADLRFHRAQVLGIRLQRTGLATVFTPELETERPVETDQVGLQVANLQDAARVVRDAGLGHFLTGNYTERDR